MPQGYWALNKYKRKNVYDEVTEFIGWDYLVELVEKCENLRDQGLISSLFLTGGRVSEVLALRKKMIMKDPPHFVIRAAPVLKRFKKIDHYFDDEGNKHWITKAISAYRTFPFPDDEPLVPYFVEFLETVEDNLFNIGRVRSYQIVKKLDSNLFNHWFRAQRASQLAFEYGFDVHDLVEWFNWKDIETALHYSSKGYKSLAAKMAR